MTARTEFANPGRIRGPYSEAKRQLVSESARRKFVPLDVAEHLIELTPGIGTAVGIASEAEQLAEIAGDVAFEEGRPDPIRLDHDSIVGVQDINQRTRIIADYILSEFGPERELFEAYHNRKGDLYRDKAAQQGVARVVAPIVTTIAGGGIGGFIAGGIGGVVGGLLGVAGGAGEAVKGASSVTKNSLYARREYHEAQRVHDRAGGVDEGGEYQNQAVLDKIGRIVAKADFNAFPELEETDREAKVHEIREMIEEEWAKKHTAWNEFKYKKDEAGLYIREGRNGYDHDEYTNEYIRAVGIARMYAELDYMASDPANYDAIVMKMTHGFAPTARRGQIEEVRAGMTARAYYDRLAGGPSGRYVIA